MSNEPVEPEILPHSLIFDRTWSQAKPEYKVPVVYFWATGVRLTTHVTRTNPPLPAPPISIPVAPCSKHAGSRNVPTFASRRTAPTSKCTRDDLPLVTADLCSLSISQQPPGANSRRWEQWGDRRGKKVWPKQIWSQMRGRREGRGALKDTFKGRILFKIQKVTKREVDGRRAAQRVLTTI